MGFAREQHLTLVERVSPGRLDSELQCGQKVTDHASYGNVLLAALPPADQARIKTHLTSMTLPLGTVIYEPGDHPDHISLPVTAVVSILQVKVDGATTEIAVIGRDGLLGMAAFLGGEPVSSRAVVQSEGLAYCLDAAFALEKLARGGPLQERVLRFSQALITQMAQTAICNRHQSVFQQFCRWLLLSLDRLDSNAVPVRDDLIAGFLGVSAATAAQIAKQLENMGAIRYHSSYVEVLDRRSIESQVCGCYSVVKREYDRLLRNWI